MPGTSGSGKGTQGGECVDEVTKYLLTAEPKLSPQHAMSTMLLMIGTKTMLDVM